MDTEKAEIYVGIDIGVEGAIATYSPGQHQCVDMPVLKIPVLNKNGKPIKKKKKTIYDIDKMVEFFKHLDESRTIVFIEKAQILPHGFTIKGNIGVARCQAIFEGILKALGFKYQVIDPKVWQHYFGIETQKDTVGNVISDTKDQSMKKCKEMFPGIPLETERGRKLDGRADALLIMEYGRRITDEQFNT